MQCHNDILTCLPELTGNQFNLLHRTRNRNRWTWRGGLCHLNGLLWPWLSTSRINQVTRSG